MTLGETLLRARQREGISARRLAELAGLSPSYVTKLEQGQIDDPGLRAFSRLATVLHLSAAEVRFCLTVASMDPTNRTDVRV